MAENHQIAGEPPVTVVWFVCDIKDWFIWILSLWCFSAAAHKYYSSLSYVKHNGTLKTMLNTSML